MCSSGAVIVAVLRLVPFPKCASSNYEATQTPHTHKNLWQIASQHNWGQKSGQRGVITTTLIRTSFNEEVCMCLFMFNITYTVKSVFEELRFQTNPVDEFIFRMKKKVLQCILRL